MTQLNRNKTAVAAITVKPDAMGVTWWNGMTRLERATVLGQAERKLGRAVSAAECWELWRRGQIRMDGIPCA